MFRNLRPRSRLWQSSKTSPRDQISAWRVLEVMQIILPERKRTVAEFVDLLVPQEEEDIAKATTDIFQKRIWVRIGSRSIFSFLRFLEITNNFTKVKAC